MSRKLLAGMLGIGIAVAAAGVESVGASTEPPGSGPAEVATGNGVSDDEIRVAVLNGFTGPVANLAIPAADGMDAYFNMVNEAGGVCGRSIVLGKSVV